MANKRTTRDIKDVPRNTNRLVSDLGSCGEMTISSEGNKFIVNPVKFKWRSVSKKFQDILL